MLWFGPTKEERNITPLEIKKSIQIDDCLHVVIGQKQKKIKVHYFTIVAKNGEKYEISNEYTDNPRDFFYTMAVNIDKNIIINTKDISTIEYMGSMSKSISYNKIEIFDGYTGKFLGTELQERE